jgi:tungstate transport system ATP-binding protein
MANVIALRDIEIHKNGRAILAIRELEIPMSGITAVIGPNGAGKTTLLKLIHGVISPDRGHCHTPDVRSALVLHHTPLIRASVKTNLALVKDAFPDISSRDIDQALADVGLASFANRTGTLLSAGERQRLSLARALLQKPQLFLLDEPTANLDPSATDQVENIVKKMTGGVNSIVFTSHHLGQVQRLADRVIYLANGEVLEMNSTQEFFTKPRSTSAQHFLARELGWK